MTIDPQQPARPQAARPGALRRARSEALTGVQAAQDTLSAAASALVHRESVAIILRCALICCEHPNVAQLGYTVEREYAHDDPEQPRDWLHGTVTMDHNQPSDASERGAAELALETLLVTSDPAAVAAAFGVSPGAPAVLTATALLARGAALSAHAHERPVVQELEELVALAAQPPGCDLAFAIARAFSEDAERVGPRGVGVQVGCLYAKLGPATTRELIASARQFAEDLIELIALWQRIGLPDGALDHAVHDSHATKASEINNQGPAHQIEHLLRVNDRQTVHQLIEEALACEG